MTSHLTTLLQQVKTFKSLDQSTLERIARHCSLQNYKRSQTVITHNETTCDVYFIVSGSVRATLFSPLGKEISYQDIPAGEMFGELAAIDHQPRSTHVIALVESNLLKIPGDIFMQLLSEHPTIAQATLKKMASLVRFLCDRVYKFGALDVNRRIRAELVRIAAPDGLPADCHNPVTITEMPKHQELANRLATHREAVSRELKSLEQAGVIAKEKHSLVINDLSRLQAMVWDE